MSFDTRPGAPVFRPASPAQRAKLPSSLRCMAQQATSMAQRHPRVRTAVRRPRIGPVNRRTWRREFRGLRPRCRCEHRRSCPFWMASRHPYPLGGSALSPDGFRQSREHGGGSFAACGRDAGLKTGAPAPSGWRPATPTGFCVVPGRVPAIGAHSGGSFAACGRDARSAGLQTGIARAAGETPVVTSLHGAAGNKHGATPPTRPHGGSPSPDRPGQSANMAEGVSRPAAAMPV